MGKYEASFSKRDRKKAADTSHTSTPSANKKRKKKSRVGLIAVLSVLTLIAVGAIWLLQPPAVPNRPDQTGEPPVTKDPDNTAGNTAGGNTSAVGKGERVRKDNFFTFLVLGTNDDYNTDVIMLASLDLSDSSDPKVDIVNIPRDSMVDFPSVIKRINGVYGYYRGQEKSKEKGLVAVKEKVEEITGVYADYYCLINLKAFLKIVDIVGGVDFNVPYNMYHPDKDESQTINLKKGQQTLTSKKALQLVRFRGTSGGDLDRINMQKDFLIAMLKTVKNNFTIGKIPDLLSTVWDSITTDMPMDQMVRFATHGLYPLDADNGINFHTLPISHMGKYASGKYGNQDYIYLDEDAIVELVNKTVNPFTTDIEVKDLNILILEND